MTYEKMYGKKKFNLSDHFISDKDKINDYDHVRYSTPKMGKANVSVLGPKSVYTRRNTIYKAFGGNFMIREKTPKRTRERVDKEL